MTTDLWPSGSATVTRSSRLEDAAATLGEVRAEDWPKSEEARAAISWACQSLESALITCARLRAGEMAPYDVLAPDMGWWDDPQAQAEEYVEDQAVQLAAAARKRLAEYRQREAESIERAREWMQR